MYHRNMVTPQHLENALKICVKAHDGQIDRDGFPHSFHCIRVAQAQKTPYRTLLGLLHDVLEDGGETWYITLVEEFGQEVVGKLLLLRHTPKFVVGKKTSYMNYIKKLCEDEDCMHVKMADIKDNMRPERRDKRTRKKAELYGEAFDYIRSQL